MNRRCVLFRAEGSAQIGLGHVMRCLALAEMLGPDYNRRLAMVQPAPNVVAMIEAKGVEVVALTGTAVNEFLTHLQPNEVVVLDGYAFDETYQRAVHQQAKALVYIDDLVAGHQVANVVVNHAGGLTPDNYKAEPYTQFLLGPNYALLRPPFFQSFTSVPKEGPVFVSLGGADPSNTTLAVLQALLTGFRLLNQEWRVHVVVGPLQANRPAIEAMQQSFKFLYILSSLTAEQMVAELVNCQLAITACSTVAYEVCCVGRPLVAIQTADNQARLANFLSEKKLADVLQASAEIDVMTRTFYKGLSRDQQGFWQIRVQNQRHFFDGLSPERFRALFFQLCS